MKEKRRIQGIPESVRHWRHETPARPRPNPWDARDSRETISRDLALRTGRARYDSATDALTQGPHNRPRKSVH